MHLRGRWVLTGLVTLLTVGLILAPIASVWLSAAEPIKLGEVGPLSPPGGYADGKLMKDAALLAAEEINAAGGCCGAPS
jgi:ABC-type branched-subunit amino acid transport system substrate-binding protein